MKMRNKFNASLAQRFTANPRQACHRCLQQMRQVRQAIQAEFAAALDGFESVLNLALTEAEALAWQTPYPHLFFPALAHEKAVQVRRWASHQREVGRVGGSLAFAA